MSESSTFSSNIVLRGPNIAKDMRVSCSNEEFHSGKRTFACRNVFRWSQMGRGVPKICISAFLILTNCFHLIFIISLGEISLEGVEQLESAATASMISPETVRSRM